MFITQPQDRARECGLMSADGKFPNHFQISKLDKLKAGGFYKNIQIGKNVAASHEPQGSKSGILGPEKTSPDLSSLLS